MEARGELNLPKEVRPEPPARRAAATKWLLIGAVVCVVLLVLALAARAADIPAVADGGDEALPPVAPAATMPTAEELPEDPFQRCATKALRGDYGTLAGWQRRGYQAGLNADVAVQGTATVTSYYPQEGFPRGQATRSGVGVCEKHAACLRNEWPRLRGSYVWVQPTANSQGRLVGGIRQIMDTGANSNHSRFGTAMGSDRWLDYWYPTPTELVRRVPYAIWEDD
jgi:hypothetical protein